MSQSWHNISNISLCHRSISLFERQNKSNLRDPVGLFWSLYLWSLCQRRVDVCVLWMLLDLVYTLYIKAVYLHIVKKRVICMVQGVYFGHRIYDLYVKRRGGVCVLWMLLVYTLDATAAYLHIVKIRVVCMVQGVYFSHCIYDLYIFCSRKVFFHLGFWFCFPEKKLNQST